MCAEKNISIYSQPLSLFLKTQTLAQPKLVSPKPAPVIDFSPNLAQSIFKTTNPTQVAHGARCISENQ